MSVSYTGSVLVGEVLIRTGPGSNHKLVNAKLEHEESIDITDLQQDGKRIWVKHNRGWSCAINGNNRYIDYKEKQKPMMRAAMVVEGNSQTTDTPINYLSSEEVGSIFNNMFNGTSSDGTTIKKNMRLFGSPYQFTSQVDPRVENISEKIGRTYVENIVMNAPVATIVPGKPVYLPGSSNKQGTGAALIQAANGNFEELQSLLSDSANETVRYYDFQGDYTSYMKYVNILCRTAATFLELDDEIDGTPLQRYDWRNYRWNAESYKSMASNTISSAASASSSFAKKLIGGMVDMISVYGGAAIKYFTDGGEGGGHNYTHTTTNNTDEEDAAMDLALQAVNFVQFYTDPDGGGGEDASNSTSQSKIQSMFDSGSDLVKELAFVANSGGIDSASLQQFGDASLQAAGDALSGGGQITSLFSRIFSMSSNVIKGENILMPEIYQGSEYGRNYTLKVSLKAPYGNKFCYYMECVVPLMHLLALVLPKQTTANTFGAPFLLKCYIDGVYSCNLGIASGISINKTVSPESWANDGYPTEMEVSLQIKDLYSSLTLSPQNNPMLFISNSSLVEYLATTCGLNLVQPQIGMRIAFTLKAIQNSFEDIPANVMSEVWGAAEKHLEAWITLTGRYR